MNKRTLILATTVCTTVFAQSVFAERGNGQNSGRRGPPPEAIEACGGQSEGASCSFTGRNAEQLSGVCFAPQDRDLACKPDGHDERRNEQQGNGDRGRGYDQN